MRRRKSVSIKGIVRLFPILLQNRLMPRGTLVDVVVQIRVWAGHANGGGGVKLSEGREIATATKISTKR